MARAGRSRRDPRLRSPAEPRLAQYASLEAQAAAIADDIAYDAHDIDDGLRAGLFDLAAIRARPFVAALLDEIDRLHPGLERPRVIHELTRRVITRFIEDVIAESGTRIDAAGATSLEDVQQAGRALVGFSPAIAAADRDIKAFLFANMYRHPQVTRVRERADTVVRGLFSAYVADPAAMPPDWTAKAGATEGERAHAAADYIAGMTAGSEQSGGGVLLHSSPHCRKGDRHPAIRSCWLARPSTARSQSPIAAAADHTAQSAQPR